MPVVPRTSDAGNGTEITSPSVGTKTVVGMVLGILCLFTIVLSYQLIACSHRKKPAAARRVPRNASPAAKNTHTRSKPTRSFRTCSNLFGLSKPKPAPANSTPSSSEKRVPPQDSKDGRRTFRALLLPFAPRDSSGGPETPPPSQSKPTLLERKGLRDLRLNTELLKSDGKQRYPATPSPMMTPTRKRMGRVFQFGSSPPSTPGSSTTLFSASTPTSRRQYKKLDDTPYSDWSNQAVCPTERPPEAMVSPWSPNEPEYPYAPYSPITVRWLSDTPRTPPPLYPPPPAYLPEVPMRSDGLGSSPGTPTRAGASARAGAPLVSLIVSRLSEEIDGEIGSWDMPDIRAALASVVTLVDRDDDDDDVFVIADESDGDDGSSELDSVSLHTVTDEYESMEPLSL
ncbi:hypothetical protein LXA43DRAFT_1084162 [Ganoderma leucocontextum]|nr:hypothetical protein LXA43DRAFT_1084162 [Ganoderma leucocontextum]